MSHRAGRTPTDTHVVQCGVHQRTRVKETAFPTIQRHSLHGSAAQSGAAVNTVPAWCGGAPRNRQTPSLFRPADRGV